MVSLLCALRHHADGVSGSSRPVPETNPPVFMKRRTSRSFPSLRCRATVRGCHCCCFSACSGYLLGCSTDGSAIVWRTETGEVHAVLLHPARSPLRACAVAPDSSLLVAGASDGGTVALWDFPSKALRRYRETRWQSCPQLQLPASR